MPKKTLIPGKSEYNIHTILLSIAALLLILCHGGFSETVFIAAGIFMFIMLLIKKQSFKLSVSQIIFFIFALWYFVCSLSGGFVLEYCAKGLFPMVVLGVWLYTSAFGINKEKVRDIITEISLWIALIAVASCILSSVSAGSVRRLSFPFDYSNACGIYFGVCFFCARASKEKFLQRCKYIFLIPLVLSQSVGAIGVFSLALSYTLLREKKYKSLFAVATALLLFFILFHSRIAESSGTFLERLLHIYDGLLCMADNPVFGIGAGKWEFAKQYYQSGFYTATVIHSSIISVGVNSGFVGLLLFLAVLIAELKKAWKNNETFVCVAMIAAHSFLDLTLSFTLLDVMLILFFKTAPYEKTFDIKPIFKNILSPVLILLSAFLFLCLIRSNVFQNKALSGAELTQLCDEYERDFCIGASVESGRCLATALCSDEKNDAEVSFKNYKFMPVEMIVYKSEAENERGEYLLYYLKAQPYNTELRDYITASFQSLGAEAESITAHAAENTSFLGRKLYQLKGENR